MNLGDAGKKLIKEFEGCKLAAYMDIVGVPTIGYGNTSYEDGAKVSIGDKIDKQRADELFDLIVIKYVAGVSKAVTTVLNQNQFDSLVSFAYNLGVASLQKSTLLKKVNANPNDKTISAEFEKWCRAGGQIVPGLLRRRKAESNLYFKK